MTELSASTKYWKDKYRGAVSATIRQEPEFIYRVDKQTVTLTIECSPEIMLYYFKAKEEVAL